MSIIGGRGAVVVIFMCVFVVVLHGGGMVGGSRRQLGVLYAVQHTRRSRVEVLAGILVRVGAHCAARFAGICWK